MDIEELSQKIDKYHEEDIKRANKAKYINLSYILWGFSIAVTALAISIPSTINIVMAILFWISGSASFFYSQKFKTD